MTIDGKMKTPEIKKPETITAAELQEIKTLLLKEEERLLEELNKIGVPNPKVDGDFEAQIKDIGTDESDDVSEVEQYALDKSLETTLEKSLRDVRKALNAIENKSYGTCKYCGQPINIERLKARPTSSSCISCKTKLKAS